MIRDQRGFTLIEIVVGLAIFALLAGMVSGIYSSSAKFRRNSEKSTEEYHAASLVLSKLADELTMSFYDQGRPDITGIKLDTGADGLATLEFTGKTLAIATIRAGGETKFRYEVKKQSDGKSLALVRTESSDLEEDSKGFTLEMLENIKTFKVECKDEQDWTTNWSMSAHAASSVKMPLAVRIEIGWGGEEGKDPTDRMRTATSIYGGQ